MFDLHNPVNWIALTLIIFLVVGLFIGIVYPKLLFKRTAFPPFVPCAEYEPHLDWLLYYTEDVSYRADQVDEYLSLLWHPYEWRLVGIKIHGFSEWAYAIHPGAPMSLNMLLRRMQTALMFHLRPHEDTLRIYRFVEGWCGDAVIAPERWNAAHAQPPAAA